MISNGLNSRVFKVFAYIKRCLSFNLSLQYLDEKKNVWAVMCGTWLQGKQLIPFCLCPIRQNRVVYKKYW